jgi:carboxypeptidase family protein/TonB-dependent receptor-like protein
MRNRARLSLCMALAVAFVSAPISGVAGTTGGVIGRVVDSATNAPLADVTVTVTSPSQNGTATTDSFGQYRFLSLIPDTYTISFEKTGYTPASSPGVSVFADQVETLNFSLTAALKTIAQVRASSTGVVKPGTTSDVYSVNPTMASAASGVIGPGGLSNAYGAIASVPGVALDSGEQGWFQTVHIRGGDIDQVGYELDGIPVNRVYDNAPQTMLSSLGQQELEVYTGGTPASADAQGISGYVNQVVKTGTYPGYGTINLGVGSPAFYHQASVETGGATPNRLFTYYVGIGAANQDYRFIDNNNGASDLNAFFYPVNLIDPNTFAPGPTGVVYVGAQGTNPNFLFTTGLAYGITNTQQRDNIVNLHFGLPQRNGMRDDLQMLYLTSEVYLQYFSSQNDLGFNVANDCPTPGNCVDPNVWDDSFTYNGPVMKPANPANVIPYYFPSSPQNRPLFAPLPLSIRDSNDNGVAVEKLQYTHNLSPSAFIRAYGYLLYSNWFITGPNSEAQPYYANELADYEIPDHTYGGNVSFTDQLSSKHLLTVSAGYTGSNLQRYYVGFIHPNYNVANFVGADGNCYEPTTGTQVACYDQAYGDGAGCATAPYPSNCAGTIQNLGSLPAAAPGVQGQWLITNTNFNAALNQVHTRFSGYSVTDQWRPNDALTVNAGLRIENFRYIFGGTLAGDPARAFWFKHYNQEFCQVPGQAPFFNGLGGCPAGSSSPNLVNTPNAPDYVTARFQPRLGFTYTLSPNTVLRGSFGVYARPPNSSWVEYNVVQSDLPTYLGSHFAAFGFKTPEHYIRPDTSYNYDVSWEQRLKGTDWSFKISPFYRATRDQLQNFFIDPNGGLESGLNVGSQRSGGIEVAIQKGDFNRNGWAGQLAYTYTHSTIRYQNFPGQSINVIDQLNTYVQQYNSFTKAGGGSPTYTNGGVTVSNPYYNQPEQPLFDRNASYTTYDVIPGPFAASNGYAVPHVATLLLNYRQNRFAVSPSVTYSSGASYGSPTQWPGYDPSSCTATLTGTTADPASCTGFLFIPDKYTGKFDNLGAFTEPWRISASLGMSYDFSPRVTAKIALVNIVDYCGQRGYAWDNSNVCVYGSLPSGILAPAGNFYPNSNAATPPPPLQFPYSFWFNGNNTGFLGVRVPMQATFALEFKL